MPDHDCWFCHRPVDPASVLALCVYIHPDPGSTDRATAHGACAADAIDAGRVERVSPFAVRVCRQVSEELDAREEDARRQLTHAEYLHATATRYEFD